jgi:filamentous hemagglutinin family protein
MTRSKSMVGLVLLVSIGFPTASIAQVVPDNTVGTIVNAAENIFTINNGTRSGNNLFHSFSQFSVPTGGSAIFNNATDVQTIFSRVTGSSSSSIDGLIKANGTASLFLMNPNGIVFGPNATLNIGGSFTGTTANRIQFTDGVEFSTANAIGTPLLAINVPIGLQRGRLSLDHQAGDIHMAGNLAVPAGQSLTLLGKTVWQQGTLTAPGGTVQVLGDRVALLDKAQINVSSPTQGGTVQIGGDYQGQGTIPLATATYIAPTATVHADAHTTGNGGQIIAWGTNSLRAYGTLTARGGDQAGNGGLIETSSRGGLDVTGVIADASAAQGTAGTWLIDPRNITISRTTPTSNGTFDGLGLFTPSGDDVVIAEADIQSRLNAGTSVFITTGTTGNQAGNITANGFGFPITATTPVTFTLQAANNIDIDFQNAAFGSPNNLNLKVVMEAGNDISLRNSIIHTTDFTLQANNNIHLKDFTVRTPNNNIPLNVNLEADRDRSGQGNLTIEGGLIALAGGSFNARAMDMTMLPSATRPTISPTISSIILVGSIVPAKSIRLDVRALRMEGTPGLFNGPIIRNVTRGIARGGDIIINASTVDLGENATVLTNTIGTGLGAGGDGGDLVINASTIDIGAGASVWAATSGAGAGGSLTLRASDRISIDGIERAPVVATSSDATGTAGALTLEAPNIQILNSASVSSSSSEQGRGGDISIRANRLEVAGIRSRGGQDAALSTYAFDDGLGGSISIDTQSLRVADSGRISTSNSKFGSAGDIRIRAQEVIVEGISPFDSSGQGASIDSSSAASINEGGQGGDAGDITIDTARLIIRDRGFLSTDTSTTGSAGDITINASESVLISSTIPNSLRQPRWISSELPILVFEKIITGITSSTNADVVDDNTPDIFRWLSGRIPVAIGSWGGI